MVTIDNFLKDGALSWFARVIFFAFSFVLLCFVYEDALRYFFWNGYFLYDGEFAQKIIFRGGGLLVYVGRFMSQSFKAPWLGALLFSLLLTILQVLVEKLTKRSGGWGISFLPSSLCLMGFLLVRYLSRYGEKIIFDVAWFWTPVVGSILACVWTLLYRKIRGKEVYKWIVNMVLFILSYPYLGVFSIVAIILITISAREKNWLYGLSIVVLCPILVHFVSYFYDENWLYVVFSPIPVPMNDYGWVFLSAVLSILLIVLIARFVEKGTTSLRKTVFSVVMFFIPLCAVAGVVALPYNVGFRSDMRLLQLAKEKKWEEIIEEVDMKDRLTHYENAFRVVALSNTDKLLKKMFDFVPPLISQEDKAYPISSPYLYFYGSLFSSAVQLNMEDWVIYGETYERLKRFAILALLNNEGDLAHRYIEVMKKTGVLDNDVQEMEKYLFNRKSMYEDNPLYVEMKKHEFAEIVDLNGMTLFYKNFLSYSDVNYDNVERRLLADIYIKDLDFFLKDLNTMLRFYDGKQLPVYFQQAVAVKIMLTGNFELQKRFAVSKEVGEVVEAIARKATEKKYTDEEYDEVAWQVATQYPNNYATYYFFDNQEFSPW